ncbi:PepSY-associated TM helix domain-containing protein [Sporomusa malonica]|uniref:PepSY-associated TM region n=1 Tax=Sporomusa malonica TaxID=112901 RepID=A0A1W2C1X8_9FIRM|nr:PepSY-associated TM helix domain-containing protein [Sporomusa malonica]SMC79101.1 PepSY-associated TM region [Sporomusa malonica]
MHMWIGLILAIVLLIEAVTGLILAEPWIVGQQGKPQMPQASPQSNIEQGTAPTTRGVEPPFKPASNEFNAFGFAKGLHQGKVGGFELKWIVDFSAIGLIILTVTGVYLSIPILKVRRNRR